MTAAMIGMARSGLDVHRERARSFAASVIAPSVAARDRESRWDGDLFRRLGDAGFLRAGLPLVYGGSDLRAGPVMEMLAGFGEGSGDGGIALAWAAHLYGAVIPILRLGTEAQRRRFLPALGRGEWIGALAHTEPSAAGDPVGVAARAVRRGDRWVLRGRKTWVANGSVGHVFVVTAVTDPKRKQDGVSAFIIERGAPGLHVGRRLETTGLRTATIAEIEFDDCVVPEDHLLGAEGAGLTQAFRLIQRWQRGSLFAPWIGLVRSLLDRSVAHAREHLQLGKPLSCSQSTRATLADMRIRYELCQRLQARSAWQLDHGGDGADRDLAVARLFLVESLAQITREATEIHGAAGVEVDRLTERLLRDAAVIAHLGEGTTMLRSVIAGSLLGLG